MAYAVLIIYCEFHSQILVFVKLKEFFNILLKIYGYKK